MRECFAIQKRQIFLQQDVDYINLTKALASKIVPHSTTFRCGP